ncbi:phage protease, partial [Acinetobacter baumannii]|nr:phage protease [Acinetobacter baumannii]
DGTYGTTLVAGQSFTDAFVKAIEAKSAANNSQTPDPTKYVPIAVYQEAIASANSVASKAVAKEIDDLIVAACSDGRLT